MAWQYSGNRANVRAASRGDWLCCGLDTLMQDVGYGLRSLRRAPGFACIAIVTLALAIGANTMVFSVLEALVLRPLAIEDPDRVVLVESNRNVTVSIPDYVDVRDRNSTFTGVAAYRVTSMAVDAGSGAQQLWGYLATANYFELLGVRPAVGRFFTELEADRRNESPYAVLSHDTWRRLFGGDASIAGKTVRINGLPYTILGVAPASFDGTEVFYRAAIWVPMSMQPQIEGRSWLDERVTENSLIIGRLKPQITRTQALSDLNSIAQAIADAQPRTHEGFQFRFSTPGLFGSTGRGVFSAFITGVLVLSLLVLLAACANLASMLASRVMDRSREIAMRLSLGASRGRIVRLLLVETTMVTTLGGVGGFVLAAFALRLLTEWRLPLPIPVRFLVTPDAWVFLFAAAITMGAAVFAVLAPARRAWRTDPAQLTGSMAAAFSGRRWGLRDVLLGAQVTVCVLLVMSSLIAVRGLAAAFSTPLGFRPEGLSAVGVDLSTAGYDAQAGTLFKQRVLEDVSRIAGITNVAMTNALPLTPDQNNSDVFPDDGSPPRPANALPVAVYQVSPGYFEVAGTRLLSGRDFTQGDRINTPPVAIVNEAFARRVMRTSDPVGKRFRYGPGGTIVEVAGMVETGKYYALTETPRPTVFFSMYQRYNSSMMVVARSTVGESQAATLIGRAVQKLDPRLPLQVQQGVGSALALAFLPSQVAVAALGSFGILAIALAVTGIYGLASYSVSARLRELGIRLAIGAPRWQLLRSALGRIAVLLAGGSIIGIGLGIGTQSLLAAVVYQASSRDPLLIAAVAITMSMVGLCAAWLPARRAMKVDPARTLRA
jgi:predicted permease